MAFDLAHPTRTIHAGIILLDGETEILDVAPIDLLCGISEQFMDALPIPGELKAQALDVQFHWVTEKGEPAKATSGLMIPATDSFATCPPLDIALIGARSHGPPTPHDSELTFIRKAHEQCSAFLGICGGFIELMHAGLLVGKTATAPRPMLSRLREQAPQTKWMERRQVHDGKIWTSGTLLNGLDLMKAFVETTWGGTERAELVHTMIGFGGWPVRDVEYGSANVMEC